MREIERSWIMGKLAGRVAVVTGASKGIGASIAEHLAAEGASVVVNYASNKAAADAVVRRITDQGGKAVAVQGDVSKPEDVKRLFAETQRAYGKVDVLVNNAGVYEGAPLADITPEHFHKHFNLNVLGVLLTTQEAVKLMDSRGGSIINMSSIVGPMPAETLAVYSGTKAAVDAITVSLSKELGAKRIREWWRRKACIPRASLKATSAGWWSPRRRSDASPSRKTSPVLRCSLLPKMPGG
jgi:3-oxoacyl-[acyl-carrier protein] reductase